MRRVFVRARLLAVLFVLAAMQMGSAHALPKADFDCSMGREELEATGLTHAQLASRFIGQLQYGPQPRTYKTFERVAPEEKQAPDGEHGTISFYLYHLEYDRFLWVWCPCLDE